jgi:transmembrane sensor
MDEKLLEKVHEAKDHVAVRWDESRARTLERRLLSRVERQRPSYHRLAFALAAAMMVLGVAVGINKVVHRPTVASNQPESSHPPAPRTLRLEDGTSIALATDESSIRTLESGPKSVGIEVVKGAAHFDVIHDPARLFRVVAGGVTVEVIGTAFMVELRPAGARVAVDRGRVRVRWADQIRMLSAGEAAVFDDSGSPEGALDELTDEGPQDGGGVAVPSASTGLRRASPGEWRSLAHDGDFSKAYDALRGEGPGAVRDEPNELLLQADVARLSGHPDQAVAPLRRVLSRHGSDAQAPLAAFTLGRVLLDELKRPREAAGAFARVYRLTPGGPLAQDALAREVEAWSRAGETGIARARAQRYIESYPQGRKLNAVRHYGGLE